MRYPILFALLVFSWGAISTRAADPPRTPGGEPVVGRVRSASSLVGAELRDANGRSHGKVTDLMIDLGRGGVVSLRVDSGLPNPANVPLSRVVWGAGNQMSLTTDLTNAPAEVADPHSQSQLVPFHAIKGKQVYNPQGQALGFISDLGLAEEKGLIAYVVLKRPENEPGDDAMLPIPLGAFIVPEHSKRWILDLPADVLANTPTFKASQWPETMPRAWVEYVAVRYGRSPFGGVERKTSPQKQ